MIPAPADLLVIGGLTVDRFADGSAAPGGSVLHIARAVAPRRIQAAAITVAGPEAEAQAGLDELRRLATAVEAASATTTATFAHRESPGGRRLRLERRGGQLHIAGSQLLRRIQAVLVAPIAGEVEVEDLAQLGATSVRGAILQGWLRSLDEGAQVRSLPLGELGAPLITALASFDLLVASREDLAAVTGDPAAQLSALRRAFGPRPALAVTDGPAGVWFDEQRADARHLPAPRLVEVSSTVGAGDVLAALLTLALGRGEALEPAAEAAMEIVATILEARGG